MPFKNTEFSDEILVELRKIVRAMDLQSRQLQRDCALTSPQLVLLREIVRHEEIAIGTLAANASLSNATATGIVDRLEQRGLVARSRNGKDRRQVLLSSTEAGRALCDEAPPLMQEKFLDSLSGLQQSEQTQMLTALSQLAGMMNGLPPEPSLAEEDCPPDGFVATCQMLREKEAAPTSPSNQRAIKPVLLEVHGDKELPRGMTRESLAHFLNEHLRPYEDAVEDILSGLNYALSSSKDKGGFVLLALLEEQPVGALVILNTGMSGYVPEHMLLFVAVTADMRGQGIGAQLIRRAQRLCSGNMKLHVEYDNPARRLYERMGFASKYADMRWNNESSDHKS